MDISMELAMALMVTMALMVLKLHVGGRKEGGFRSSPSLIKKNCGLKGLTFTCKRYTSRQRNLTN